MNCDNCGGSLTGGNDTRQTLKDNVEGDEHCEASDCIQALGEKGSGLELLVGNLSNSKQDKEFMDRAFGGSLLNRRNSERRKGGQ
ncbi:hypothetical protein LCGC14_0412510 [marine sediment metagenome]|uniref:Uncharacterized protein n=1 Tax=marine sediment metagenome TaxID=412755 RepID=A0A0F9STM8_9ZZZZ